MVATLGSSQPEHDPLVDEVEEYVHLLNASQQELNNGLVIFNTASEKMTRLVAESMAIPCELFQEEPKRVVDSHLEIDLKLLNMNLTPAGEAYFKQRVTHYKREGDQRMVDRITRKLWESREYCQGMEIIDN